MLPVKERNLLVLYKATDHVCAACAGTADRRVVARTAREIARAERIVRMTVQERRGGTARSEYCEGDGVRPGRASVDFVLISTWVAILGGEPGSFLRSLRFQTSEILVSTVITMTVLASCSQGTMRQRPLLRLVSLPMVTPNASVICLLRSRLYTTPRRFVQRHRGNKICDIQMPRSELGSSDQPRPSFACM